MSKLIYVMDPMCGWCYGFGKTMEQVAIKFGEDLDIEVLPGGMWVDDGMVATSPKLYDYIEKSISRIEKVSGAVFGQRYMAYLKQDGHLMDSFPGSKAIVTATEMNSELSLKYTEHLQQKIYSDGKGLTAGQWEVFADAAEEVGLDRAIFIQHYQSSAMAEKTRKTFQRVKGFDVNGYPALFYQSGEKIRTISTGFEAFETVQTKIEALLKTK